VTETPFTELIGCRLPLQQAGMGGVATTELALAVARARALGLVGAAGVPADVLAHELQQIPADERRSIGANFLMPFVEPAAVEAATRLVRVVEFFYGDPDPFLVSIGHEGNAIVGWQVGSPEEAGVALDAGCDFIVAQGVEAGGHVRGTVGLLPLLDEVLDAVDVPVVASGGIGTARAVAAVLAAGAGAARVGTRFVAAAEADAHPRYVEALVRAGSGDTVLTETFSLMWEHAPHRVLRSSVAAVEGLVEDLAGETTVGGMTVPVPRLAPSPPTRLTTGRIDAMALYAGQAVGAVTGVQPAAEIVRELCALVAT